MHRSAERLTLLLSDLLDLSRIEAGKLATEPTRIDLHAAVDTVAEALIAPTRERDITLSNEIAGGVAVIADATGLSQVLQNLMDNAIKYAPDGGHVWVRSSEHGERVRIEVQDDGPGIEAKHRKRVFERFYRVDPGRSRRLGGTGLGLAIVKHICEQMNGRVGVAPAPERGSIFWVELPSDHADAPLSSSPSPADSAADSDGDDSLDGDIGAPVTPAQPDGASSAAMKR
jgi:two-component system phosphate regulon sensor histidine kinase PhoR